jgi:hypothetical protein
MNKSMIFTEGMTVDKYDDLKYFKINKKQKKNPGIQKVASFKGACVDRGRSFYFSYFYF